MYITRDLREKLQERRDRLYNAYYTQLDNELDVFLVWLKSQPILNSILTELENEANSLNPHPLEKCKNCFFNNALFSIFENQFFSNEKERSIYHYSFLEMIVDELFHQEGQNIYESSHIFQNKRQGSEFRDFFPQDFTKQYVDPLVNYILDRIDKGSAILCVLEKYKKRCEWFQQEDIRKLYDSSEHQQEAVLDRDFRRYLFDQGIDYPFSTPSSASGRADVVGLLETEDPLVLEVKIFDRTKTKSYGKNRIIDGFTQIVNYANDYNKPIGYLLVFNMDTAEVEIVTNQKDKSWPTKIVFAGKTYFIIFVNIPPLGTPSASKKGRLKKVTLMEDDLTADVSA